MCVLGWSRSMCGEAEGESVREEDSFFFYPVEFSVLTVLRLSIINREENMHFEELSMACFKSDFQKNLHLRVFTA